MRISSQVSAVLKIKFLSIFVYVTAPTPSRLLLHLSPLKLPNAFQVNNCDIEPFLSLFSSFCLFVVVVVVLGGCCFCVGSLFCFVCLFVCCCLHILLTMIFPSMPVTFPTYLYRYHACSRHLPYMTFLLFKYL